MGLPVSTTNISEKHAASYCRTKCRKPTYKRCNTSPIVSFICT